MTFRNFKSAVYPLVGVAVILLIWQTYTYGLSISRIVLPSPADILRASITNWDVLLRETWPTFLESVLGFLLAVIIGIPVAVCVANSRILNLTLYPILIATQSVPKVAIAPIILVWFGLGMIGLIGWSVTVPALLGLALGLWLDRQYPGTHAWTLALFVGGLTLGCFNAWHWVDKEDRSMHRTQREGNDDVDN